MNTTHKIQSTRFLAALGVAAAAAATPALLFAGAGTAHADDPCSGAMAYSYYCSPGAGALNPALIGRSGGEFVERPAGVHR